MLDRSIATMARVKEGTMGQGGVQTGEEDNVKTFTFQLVYQKEKGKEVTNSWEELVSADREELVGESSQPMVRKENQKVICCITGESRDVVSTSDSVEQRFEVTYMTEPMEDDGQELHRPTAKGQSRNSIFVVHDLKSKRAFEHFKQK